MAPFSPRLSPSPKSAEPAAAALRSAPAWGPAPGRLGGWGRGWRVPEPWQRRASGTTHRAGDHTVPVGGPGEGRGASAAGRVLAPAHLADRARGPRRATPLHPYAVPALTSGREGAGCGGCWGATSCLLAELRGGQ